MLSGDTATAVFVVSGGKKGVRSEAFHEMRQVIELKMPSPSCRPRDVMNPPAGSTKF